MNNEGFSLRNPAIITTQKFSDGEFYAIGHILLGMDHSRDKFLSFNILPIYKGCFCSLFEWEFDRFHISVTNPCKEYHLFSQKGKIASNPNNFEIQLIEFSEEPLKYLVIGRSIMTDASFIHVSLIMDDEKTHNFHFSVNDSNFEFNASNSILLNPLSIAINCLSTVKFITIVSNESSKVALKTTMFDVENYLKTRLQCNIKNIDFYETEIIGKNKIESAFIVFVGLTFYNEANGRWTAAAFLINIPVNGKTMRLLHQDTSTFEKRPQGEILKETVFEWKNEYLSAASEKIDPKLNYLTNKNRPGIDLKGVRLIKIPEMNLILADERNGIIKF